MYNTLNEIPTYNLSNYLEFQMNEAKQYELFEKLDFDYDIKQEWEDVKEIIVELYKKGFINMGKGICQTTAGLYNVGKNGISAGIHSYKNQSTNKDIDNMKHGASQLVDGTVDSVKGIAYTTKDVFLLLTKLSKAVLAAIKYLVKCCTKQEARDKMLNILQQFKNSLLTISKKLKRISFRKVIILFLGISMTAGVVYEIANPASIMNEYRELIQERKQGIVDNKAKGVDISRYQDLSEDDWQLIEDNCQFVIIKCGAGFNGPRMDAALTKHYENAKKHNLNVGVYYFLTDHKDPEAQFNLLCQSFDKIGGKTKLDIKPVIDLENGSVVSGNKAKYQETVRAFMDLYIEKFGEAPIIYTGARHLQDYGLEFLYKEYNCPIWAAHYDKRYKGQSIDKQKDVFMSKQFGLKDSTVMLQYSETGDGQLVVKDHKGRPALDVDVCWDWNAIKN